MRRLLTFAVLSSVAFASLGCGSDDNEPGAKYTATAPVASRSPAGGSPTPSTSPTSAPAACPVAADVCTFAATVARDLAAADLTALIAAARPQQYTCPATRPQGLGGPYPLCDTAAPNEKREGFQLAYLASEGQIVDPAGLRAAITRWLQSSQPSASDQYGSGATRIYTVACPAGIVPCNSQFALVFSNLQSTQPNSFRLFMMLYFERQGSQTGLVFAGFGPLLQPGEEQAALKGGAVQNFLKPQPWPPIAVLYPLMP